MNSHDFFKGYLQKGYSTIMVGASLALTLISPAPQSYAVSPHMRPSDTKNSLTTILAEHCERLTPSHLSSGQTLRELDNQYVDAMIWWLLELDVKLTKDELEGVCLRSIFQTIKNPTKK